MIKQCECIVKLIFRKFATTKNKELPNIPNDLGSRKLHIDFNLLHPSHFNSPMLKTSRMESLFLSIIFFVELSFWYVFSH